MSDKDVRALLECAKRIKLFKKKNTHLHYKIQGVVVVGLSAEVSIGGVGGPGTC